MDRLLLTLREQRKLVVRRSNVMPSICLRIRTARFFNGFSPCRMGGGRVPGNLPGNVVELAVVAAGGEGLKLANHKN
jgi:hypothetical protein